MREGNQSSVSGGASLHGPMRGPRGVGRGPRWIVCSVIAGRLAGDPPACGHRTRREACWLFERGARVVHALLHVADLCAQVTDEAIHTPRLRVRPI